MTQIHNVSHQPLPSSILHNGNDVRRQYTRAAAKQAVAAVSRKISAWKKRAANVTPDYQPALQGYASTSWAAQLKADASNI
jgi:hypothetical protein